MYVMNIQNCKLRSMLFVLIDFIFLPKTTATIISGRIDFPFTWQFAKLIYDFLKQLNGSDSHVFFILLIYFEATNWLMIKLTSKRFDSIIFLIKTLNDLNEQYLFSVS